MTVRALTPDRPRDPAPAVSPGGSVRRLRELLAARRLPPLPVLLFLLFILFPIEFNLGNVFMTGPRVILLVMIIPCCIRLLTGQLGRVLPTDLLFLLFAIWNILILFIHNPDQALSFGGSVALEMFGSYMLARAYVRSPEDFARTCLALFWVIVATLPLAIYESRTGTAPIPMLISKLPFFYSVADFNNALAGVRMGLYRSQVIFSHPIHYGLFCSTAFSLAFVGFKGILGTLARIFFSLSAMLGVFFSLSSGAILPVIVQIVLIFWAWALDKVKSRWLIFGGIGAFFYVLIDSLSNRTPITVLLEYGTFSPHNAYWRIIIFEWGMKNVWTNPFLGIGMNPWERPWFMHSGSLDNFWLLNAVRYGIPGFLLLAAGFALVYLRVMFRDLDGDRVMWLFRRAWVITLTSLILTLCTVHVWATAQAYVFFLFGAGVWLMWYRPAPQEAADADRAGHPPQRRLAYSRFSPGDKRPPRLRPTV